MTEFLRNGKCLCEAIQFEIIQKPMFAINCHCSMCRRVTGSTFAPLVGIRENGGIRYLTDTTTIQDYQSSEKFIRKFCSRCGSCFALIYLPSPDYLWIYGGTILGDLGVSIEGHMYVGSKASWYEIKDGLPTSEGPEQIEVLLQKYKISY